MSRTYTATGINLKSSPLGEADRILTILTREYGLIRAVAPASRSPKAKLGGRGELFVVNELLLSKGRSLDRITQAESLGAYPALSRDLAKLMASQYWAEIILYLMPHPDPNIALFDLLRQRLTNLVDSPTGVPVLVELIRGVWQLLQVAGLTPRLDRCCVTGRPLVLADLGHRSVLFSPAAGGVILPHATVVKRTDPQHSGSVRDALGPQYGHEAPPQSSDKRFQQVLAASEVALMQQSLVDQEAIPRAFLDPTSWSWIENGQSWLNIERALRRYVEFHADRPIRSAILLEGCFPSNSSALSAVYL